MLYRGREKVIKINISIFGLGYVGSVTAACLAKNGHSVIGIDLKDEKVRAINEGKSPVYEKGLDELINKMVNNGRLRATTSAEEAVKNSECSLLCVGTPSNFDGSINLGHIKRVCTEIGRVLKDKNEFHVVVIRSTVIPDTTESILIPILENESRKKVVKDFGVGVNPEFMREGQALHDFYNPGIVVIGDTDKKTGDLVEEIYTKINASIIRVNIKTAEIIKYVFNSFHGIKVAFANEIGSLCKKLGMDSRVVMDIFCKDRKLNLSSYYLKPGFAFGGSCIPKDLKALLHKSKELEVDCPLIDSVLDSNQKHIEKAVELIMHQGKRRIGIFGLTFKSGTEDTRESPTISMITKLLEKGYLKLFEKGYDIGIYDPMANVSEIEGTLPHIAPMLNSSLETLVKKSEVIVVTKNEDIFKKIPMLMTENQILIDMAGIVDPRSVEKGEYVGICW